MSAAYPCLRCGMSERNTVHVVTRQFGYHRFDPPYEIDYDEAEPSLQWQIEHLQGVVQAYQKEVLELRERVSILEAR